MSKIILYHGSPNKSFTPTFGKGDDKDDYGKGFYLTEDINLAKEWAVCRPDEKMVSFTNTSLIWAILRFWISKARAF